MITLSRLNGQVVAINPDLISWIEVTPDTMVSLLGGEKIMVREPLDEVIAKVIAFRNQVNQHDIVKAHRPSGPVLQAIQGKRNSSRPSVDRVARLPTSHIPPHDENSSVFPKK